MSESMKDFEAELEQSYSMMGDGVHDTDTLLAWQKAKELLESQENITVTINGIVKGGVTADFDGIRAFIPASRVTLERVDDLNPFLLKEITVRVIEADMEAEKLVLSAREILKEAAADIKKKKLSDIQIGAVMSGKVDSIKDYGAFIDLSDGLSGLVHISQISHERIKHPGVVLKEGQQVDVKVIDVKDGKISLSMKALIENPEEADVPAEGEYELPETEALGTSMADLLKNFKLN